MWGGACVLSSTVSSVSHREIDCSGSMTSTILIVLSTVNLQFQGQFVLISFLEASSWNCVKRSNSCPVYSLLFTLLTSPAWCEGFSICKQIKGHGSEFICSLEEKLQRSLTMFNGCLLFCVIYSVPSCFCIFLLSLIKFVL